MGYYWWGFLDFWVVIDGFIGVFFVMCFDWRLLLVVSSSCIEWCISRSVRWIVVIGWNYYFELIVVWMFLFVGLVVKLGLGLWLVYLLGVDVLWYCSIFGIVVLLGIILVFVCCYFCLWMIRVVYLLEIFVGC